MIVNKVDVKLIADDGRQLASAMIELDFLLQNPHDKDQCLNFYHEKDNQMIMRFHYFMEEGRSFRGL